MHWSEYLAAALWRGEELKYGPQPQVALDIPQLAMALRSFAQEQQRQSGILSGGFDPRLISAR